LKQGGNDMDHMVFKRAQAPELTDLTVDHDFGFGTIPPEI
jgi:hypothetical protein